MYARYETNWLSPAPGTRFGPYKRYTLNDLGAFG
jgi:hypothetical protein